MPELHISAEDFAYLKAGVRKAAWREVGFLGIVVFDDELQLNRVEHLRILKQEISSSEVDFDSEAHADYLEWLYTPVDKGGAGFEGTEYGLYSAHSHGSMSVFWSQTDEDAITKYGLTAPYVFSSVFNNKGDSTHRLDVFKGVETVCPLVESSRIYYKEANLAVLEQFDESPLIDSLEKIEKDYEEMFKLLEEEKKEKTKEVKEALGELQKSINAEMDVVVEADFKEFVTIASSGYPGFTRGPNGGGQSSGKQPPTSSNGSKSPPKGSSKSKGGGKQGGKDGDEVGNDLVLSGAGNNQDFWKKGHYMEVWDSTMRIKYWSPVNDILIDFDLIPIAGIPDELVERLSEADVHMLAARPDIREFQGEIDDYEAWKELAGGDPRAYAQNMLRGGYY